MVSNSFLLEKKNCLLWDVHIWSKRHPHSNIWNQFGHSLCFNIIWVHKCKLIQLLNFDDQYKNPFFDELFYAIRSYFLDCPVVVQLLLDVHIPLLRTIFYLCACVFVSITCILKMLHFQVYAHIIAFQLFIVSFGIIIY